MHKIDEMEMRHGELGLNIKMQRGSRQDVYLQFLAKVPLNFLGKDELALDKLALDLL